MPKFPDNEKKRNRVQLRMQISERYEEPKLSLTH